MISGQALMWHPECQEGANLVKVGQKKHPMEGELLVPRPRDDQEIGHARDRKKTMWPKCAQGQGHDTVRKTNVYSEALMASIRT